MMCCGDSMPRLEFAMIRSSISYFSDAIDSILMSNMLAGALAR